MVGAWIISPDPVGCWVWEISGGKGKYNQIFKDNSSLGNFMKVKEKWSLTKRILKKLKNFKKFCSRINRNSSIDLVWKTIKKFSKNISENNNNSKVTGANIVNELFIDVSLRIIHTIHSPLELTTSEKSVKFISYEIQSMLKNKKTMGTARDDISYSMIKNILKAGKEWLLE